MCFYVCYIPAAGWWNETLCIRWMVEQNAFHQPADGTKHFLYDLFVTFSGWWNIEGWLVEWVTGKWANYSNTYVSLFVCLFCVVRIFYLLIFSCILQFSIFCKCISYLWSLSWYCIFQFTNMLDTFRGSIFKNPVHCIFKNICLKFVQLHIIALI